MAPTAWWPNSRNVQETRRVSRPCPVNSHAGAYCRSRGSICHQKVLIFTKLQVPSVTKRHEASQSVTKRHEASPSVTPTNVHEMIFSQAPPLIGDVEQEPSSINMFDVLIFANMACHEFTQFAVSESNSRKYESIRQAEFLFLMSPRLHGVLHQSVGEVVRATVDWKPPNHWCHFYTGNSMRHKSGKHLEPVCSPLPWVPPTQLARCLMGADNWVEFPSVLTWLVDIASGKISLEVALELPLAEHRAACADRIAALHQRVTQLSSPSSELCTTMALRFCIVASMHQSRWLY